MANIAPPPTPPPSQSGPIPSRKHRVLACELCQKRKIGCDRKFPCANCIKVRTMRQIIDDDESEENSPESMTPDGNAEMLLGRDQPGVDVAGLWPQVAHINPLWQTYLSRVNPLTKIIHAPSLQPYFVATTTGGRDTIPKNVETLMYSIFLMAAVSMTPDECRELLGYSREEAIQQFSEGARLNLIRSSFLKWHGMTSLQALLIYISLQGRYDRHAAWILTGILVRIAQKMGLHRDGEALGLPPFECEMRRRIWWQIVMVDAKYAMFSGLGHSVMSTNCTTKTPSNLNDADMHPSAKEPFRSKDGPTEMIFCLLMCKFAKFIMEMPGFEGVIMIPDDESGPGPRTGPTEEQQATYRQGLTRLHEEILEIFESYSDANAGPVHAMAVAMKDHLFRKLEDLKKPVKLQQDCGEEVKSADDNAFRLAVGGLEHNEANYESTKDQGFAWFTLVHFQLDVFMFVVGQLRRRTEGKLVDRAWKQVEVVYSYHPELFDVTNKTYAALAVHMLHAWKNREEAIISRTGHPPDVPSCISKLRSCLPDAVCKQEPSENPTPPNPFNSDFAAPYTFDVTDAPDTTLEDFLAFSEPQSFDWDMFAELATNQGEGSAEFGPFGIAPPPTW
ncbi:fungal-specific transcription factor domain-containing protein [Corynascus novoguineensis]|uniref:Fungal-specific transcription factor domain-containing protein n=1 Tax=Corynascus novoguineensis TaxID=1126955 RepID=A0AAN7CRK9_9PEZI|nr:fungal-specific transcription factor domain-containing protein [Corynascus novoguineensis]